MELTYRGVKHQSKPALMTSQQLKSAAIIAKYRLGNNHDANKLFLIRPIHYYTYRGVSYTKNQIFAPKTQLLFNVDQK